MQLSMFLSAATAAPSLVDSLFIIPQRTFSVNCFFELFQSFFSFFVRALTPRKSRRRHCADCAMTIAALTLFACLRAKTLY